MTKTVWKTEIHSTEPFEIYASECMKVVHVDTQNGNPHFWFEHDPSEVGPIWCQVFATGVDIPADAVHCGTWLMQGGALVWHLYRLAGDPYADTQPSQEVG